MALRWWVFVLRGLAAIAFGVLAFLAPGIGLLALVLFFGMYAIVDGASNLALATHLAHGPRWGSLVAEGLASVIAGILALIWPAISAMVLLFVIAAWAVLSGVAELAAAIRLRQQIHGEWLLVLGGLLSIALGVLLFARPAVGALAMAIWIGGYSIVFGAVLAALGLRLRAVQRGPERRLPTGGMPAAV